MPPKPFLSLEDSKPILRVMHAKTSLRYAKSHARQGACQNSKTIFRKLISPTKEGNQTCDATNPGCPLTTRQPAKNSICLVSRDSFMSKMATWAHTSILINKIINYIHIVFMLVLQKYLYIFTKYLLKATFRLSSQKVPLLRTVSLDSLCT